MFIFLAIHYGLCPYKAAKFPWPRDGNSQGVQTRGYLSLWIYGVTLAVFLWHRTSYPQAKLQVVTTHYVAKLF